ncbi:hypothetical protein I3843_08G019500 [Carya illinoinensis]|uniref:Uncharacterized protein n=1 Tax=Carya illinoinensis TaxID=32201 RepID=A0A8T1PRK3_CARIL|nr:hypothetical protein CIPAW_08G018500 [Carya illinoinensis]KAG7965818.1 hypothetical protein I3843_08G019500 [Carya illinoinensis]
MLQNCSDLKSRMKFVGVFSTSPDVDDSCPTLDFDSSSLGLVKPLPDKGPVNAAFFMSGFNRMTYSFPCCCGQTPQDSATPPRRSALTSAFLSIISTDLIDAN